MKLNIKLKSSEYTMHIEGNSMTVYATSMGVGKKDGEQKLITSTLGYYGPAQVEAAVTRIIAEELTHEDEKVNLRQFLTVYKGLIEIIQPQLQELKEAISQKRSEK